MINTVTSKEQLRELYAEPSLLSQQKFLDRLDEHCRTMIRLSPFVCIATTAGDGSLDVSPRGDPPGSFHVLAPSHLLIPRSQGEQQGRYADESDRHTPLVKGRLMTVARKKTHRFRLGDWVTFPLGVRDAVAQIIEDRGGIGVGGRRLLRVRLADDEDGSNAFEMPEDDLEPAPALGKPEVTAYLKSGGLVSILQTNLIGGRNVPKAWLTLTRDGGIVHATRPDRGILGGAAVPFFALHEVKVFTGKADEVARFLTSFGLTMEEARDVIRAVGTAP